uniref:Uncharacterized protein n=1 Tax=Anopheles farauti TaxID=69004 RepID=A0A182PZF7_9DIPT
MGTFVATPPTADVDVEAPSLRFISPMAEDSSFMSVLVDGGGFWALPVSSRSPATPFLGIVTRSRLMRRMLPAVLIVTIARCGGGGCPNNLFDTVYQLRMIQVGVASPGVSLSIPADGSASIAGSAVDAAQLFNTDMLLVKSSSPCSDMIGGGSEAEEVRCFEWRSCCSTSLVAVSDASSSGSTPPPGTIHSSGLRDEVTNSTCNMKAKRLQEPSKGELAQVEENGTNATLAHGIHRAHLLLACQHHTSDGCCLGGGGCFVASAQMPDAADTLLWCTRCSFGSVSLPDVFFCAAVWSHFLLTNPSTTNTTSNRVQTIVSLR